MDPIRNPFVPGAGSPPPALAGRQEILNKAEITLARIRAGRPSKSLLLVGLRGVGKTVLLNEIENIAEENDYQTVLIEASENKHIAALLIPPLRRILFKLDRNQNVSEQVKRGLRVLKAFTATVKIAGFEIGLGIDPEIGSADSGDLESDLSELLLTIARAAESRDTAIALIIDEVQYLPEDQLGALIMAIHNVAQKQLPLVLLGAGLPQLVGLTGNAKSYAERLFEFPQIGALGNNDAQAALQGPAKRGGVSFESHALQKIVDVTQGYPYFLQEWGHHAWNIAKTSPITLEIVTEATQSATKNLDENFFRVRFDRLTPREKDYLRAMAELGEGPHRSGDIAEMLGIQVRTAGPLRGGLIKKGMIFSPAHGDTAFTVPLFDEFLIRTIPQFDPA